MGLSSPAIDASTSIGTDIVTVDGDPWPVVDGIAWMRSGREGLRLAAASACEAGDRRRALALLLADQDDWAPTAPPTPADVIAVVDGVDANRLDLAGAMDGLAFGPVADYFRYRTGDPTYLSGLELVAMAWPGGSPRVLEVACGVGHLLRDVQAAGASVTGVDVVFAKLWLARHFVVPGADLVCVDLSSPLPWPEAAFDLVVCHDALYFLPEKAHVTAELRRVAGDRGTIAIGHAHNALVDNLSAGDPLTPAGYADLLPEARLYDDADLTEACLAGAPATPCSADELADAAALALIEAPEGGAGPGGGARFDLGLPTEGARLRVNPLYADPPADADPVPLVPAWPSARYRQEYAAGSGHLLVEPVPRAVIEGAVAGSSAEVDVLVRRRVLVEDRP